MSSNSQSAEASATTMFHNDAEQRESKMINQISMDNQFLKIASTGFDQTSIKTFLEKPFLLSEFNWTVAGGLSNLYTADLFATIFANTMYSAKVNGFLNFRATTILRLQVNGNRFCQGRLIMSFIPQASVGNLPYWRSSLTQITTCPHVELDVNCDTQCIIEIPYVSPVTHYGFDSGVGTLGTIYIDPYAVLLAGSGPNTIQCALWVNFKDVELETPAIPFLAEMGRLKNITEQEEGKPVSGMLSKISKASTSLARIPLLSSIFAPAAWVTAVLSETVAIFGWSKPIDSSTVMRMVRSFAPYYNNADGQDESFVLGVSSTNKVDVLPGFAGTDDDEMSLAYLLQKKAYFQNVAWNNGQVSGTLLATFYLNPTSYIQIRNETIGAHVVTYYDCPPVAYFSSFFRYFHGSLTFTFKIVKTEFHSGRLLVCFAPSNTSPVNNTTFTKSQFLHREIIDVRYGNEFTYTFPYCSNQTWLQTFGTPSQVYGIVSIFVLNELQAPTTVNGSVNILCEVAGHSDMQLAVPGDVPFLPYSPTTRFYAQMGDTDECVISPPVDIGGSHSGGFSIKPTQFCIGECISSVKQLLLRPVRYQFSSNTFNSWVFRPFTLFTANVTAGGGVQVPLGMQVVTSTKVVNGDIFSLIACCYAYNRGGVRLKVHSNSYGADTTSANTPMWLYMSFLDYSAGVVNFFTQTLTDNIAPGQNVSCLFNDMFINPMFEILVPHYNPIHSRLNRPQVGTTTNEPVDIYSSGIIVKRYLQSSTLDAAEYISRSAADDYSLGYFIACPPMFVSTT